MSSMAYMCRDSLGANSVVASDSFHEAILVVSSGFAD